MAYVGPRDTGSSAEWVASREDSVTAWTGHADPRSGGAGHDADFSSGSAPTASDDALWVESTALY